MRALCHEVDVNVSPVNVLVCAHIHTVNKTKTSTISERACFQHQLLIYLSTSSLPLFHRIVRGTAKETLLQVDAVQEGFVGEHRSYKLSLPSAWMADARLSSSFVEALGKILLFYLTI